MPEMRRDYVTVDPLEQRPPDQCLGGVLTIGNFDGVHRGHATLVQTARHEAQRLATQAIAVTFDPPPAALLRPGGPFPPLTTVPQRCELLQQAGAQQVVVFRTTKALLNLTAAEFVEQVVVRAFSAVCLVEGESFTFGRNREGNVERLRALAELWGIPVVVCPAVMHRGRPISSSRIRSALKEGDVREAAAMLGRAYAIQGKVWRGAGRGQMLGFPTANLTEIGTLIPAQGVYAGVARPPEGTSYPAAIHVGQPLTFGAHDHTVEVHLIGFSGDLLGQKLEVAFYERLRDTQKFPSPEALREQLKRDVAAARELAANWQCPAVSPSPADERTA